jgi:hypothetical protein
VAPNTTSVRTTSPTLGSIMEAPVITLMTKANVRGVEGRRARQCIMETPVLMTKANVRDGRVCLDFVF